MRRDGGAEIPKNRQGWGQDVEKDCCFLVGKGGDWERLQPASNLHTCIVVLFCKGVRRGEGERWRQEREQTEEVRNPATSDLPTLLASLLCAIPHLTVIREPIGRVEAGHPEGWENEEKGCAQIYVCLNILGEIGPAWSCPSTQIPSLGVTNGSALL